MSVRLERLMIIFGVNSFDRTYIYGKKLTIINDPSNVKLVILLFKSTIEIIRDEKHNWNNMAMK